MENRFCLQMVSCGDGCGSNGGSTEQNVYSTEETVCGKWIDGKQIYRKVITGTLANDSGDSLVFADVSGLNIDRLVHLYGSAANKAETGQIIFQTSYNRTESLLVAVNMVYDVSAGKLLYYFVNVGGYYSGATAYVVIEYTKK
jgi:hypothetical protein